MSKEIIILCCILKELMWKMIGPSLSFKGHIIAQTKAAHQRRGNVHEAESFWPSSELAPIKPEHSSQGHLASMFIGLCKDECTRVYMNVSLHPCVLFPRDFETDIMGLLRKSQRRNLLFSLFEWDVSDVAARESVLKKNSTVKFNYIKWTRLKMERVCFESGPLQLTEHSFYHAKRNASSAAVPRLRLLQTKKSHKQSVFRAHHSRDTRDGKLSPTVSVTIWSAVELRVVCDRGDYFPLLTFRQSPSSDRSF